MIGAVTAHPTVLAAGTWMLPAALGVLLAVIVWFRRSELRVLSRARGNRT